MRQRLCFLLLLLTVAAVGRATASESPQSAVLRVHEQIRNAFLNSDTATLNQLLGDDFASVTPSGEVRNKNAVLEAFRTGESKYLSLTYEKVEVRVYGSAAVMRGIAHGEGIVKGVRLPATSHGTRFTSVFVKRGGEWRLVAHQATKIVVE